MSRLNPEGCRRAAERCRAQAPSHENPTEWVRFSQTWESIAAMTDRLQASVSLNALRRSGSVAATR
jgi:hypothetical protein